MFRTTDIVLIAAMVAGAAFTYNTKHQVEAQLAEVRRIEAKIRFEEDTMTILKADWSLLTQPSRLQQLTEIYKDDLDLRPMDPQQVVEISELPVRPPEIDEGDRLDGFAQGTTDKVITGGVVQ